MRTNGFDRYTTILEALSLHTVNHPFHPSPTVIQGPSFLVQPSQVQLIACCSPSHAFTARLHLEQASVPFATARSLHSLRATCISPTTRLPRENKPPLPRPRFPRHAQVGSNMSTPCLWTREATHRQDGKIHREKTANTAGKNINLSAPATPSGALSHPTTSYLCGHSTVRTCAFPVMSPYELRARLIDNDTNGVVQTARY